MPHDPRRYLRVLSGLRINDGLLVTVRALCHVIGVEGHQPDDPLGPFLPPVVQVNAESGAVVPGDIVTIRLRVRVEQIIPAPIQPGEPG